MWRDQDILDVIESDVDYDLNLANSSDTRDDGWTEAVAGGCVKGSR